MLIVKRKADALNFDISDDVVEYIAQKLKNNIRQLESAVKKMQACPNTGRACQHRHSSAGDKGYSSATTSLSPSLWTR